MIRVFESNTRLFENNGIKILHPRKALIHKEDNSDYYIELSDHISNIDYYQEGMIVVVDTPWGNQGFRLNNLEIKNNILSVKGRHLYYDTENYLIRDAYVVNKNCNDALDHINSSCDIISPFNFLSNISTTNSYRCIRHSLREAVETITERWEGHLKRDNWNIEIRSTVGMDKGIVLSYAKNIKTIKAKEDWSNVVTKILPVGKDGRTLPEVYVQLENELYDIPYSKVISFNQDEINEEDYETIELFETALENDLRNKALLHLQEYKTPKVNYTLNAYLRDVSDVGDVIYVNHPRCRINLKTNVIAIEYDCILKRYTKVEFGNFKKELKNIMHEVSQIVVDEVNKTKAENYTKLEAELKTATEKIWSALGESYVIYDGDKILVVDSLPKETAHNVIMINNGGIGFSNTGINGTFSTAWTIDGTLDMQRINVINLVADMIKGGTLKLGSNLNESGTLELYNDANKLICLADKTGLTIYCEDGSYIKLNPDVGFAGYDNQNNKIYWVDGDEFHQKKSVVEEEITIASRIRIIPMTTDTNRGIGFVPMA